MRLDELPPRVCADVAKIPIERVLLEGIAGVVTVVPLVMQSQAPAVPAELARGRLREKLPALRRALEGRVKPVHLTLLAQVLAHIDCLDGAIGQLHDAIDQRLAPFAESVALLQTIPGVSAKAAAVIVAEIGADMGRFATHKHLASWAGLCPGNKQSGGKRLSGKTTRGNAWLRGVLSERAWASARGKTGYLAA